MQKNITSDCYYIGVNDHRVDLFEGQYRVPNGMAYNSYVVMDEKITVFDTVDAGFKDEWLDRLAAVLDGRKPDYLVVQHMEPDHSANIQHFMNTYPDAVVVSNAKAFTMMRQFFGTDFAGRSLTVKDGDSLCTGRHTFTFVFAPMVHWPEVMVTYDALDKTLFSADGFGKFGALDVEEDWACEARRYYFGIVGKYGAQVQNLLKKAATLEIARICPLHGPVLSENLGEYLRLYDLWSSYGVESEGILIAYTSVYGHTRQAVTLLAEQLRARGCPKVVLCDLAREDMAEAVEDAFRYGRLVLATTTYNADIFPFMREFIEHLTERNFQNRTIALIENGTWAPTAAKTMRAKLEKCKNLTILDPAVTIRSAMTEENQQQLAQLADELCKDYLAHSDKTADKHDLRALFHIGYGLYVVTCRDANRDNGLIVNAVMQVTNAPNRVAVTINKQNYSHHIIRQTGVLNVNCLSEDAPFSVFENFGFQSGRTADKFAGMELLRADNGVVFLPRYINSFLSLQVERYVDLGTHGMFVCEVTEARVMSDRKTMTYDFYQEHVKPKPETEGKKGFVCKVCGYIYEGDELPEGFICPLCKHGAEDFEPIS